MSKSQSLEEEINKFLEVWDFNKLSHLLKDFMPIVELYNVDENEDWVKDELGGDEENVGTIRLIRTVYLISRLAEFHAGSLCKMNIQFKNLWKRMEKLDDPKKNY